MSSTFNGGFDPKAATISYNDDRYARNASEKKGLSQTSIGFFK